MFSNQPPLARFLGVVIVVLFAWAILPESSWTRSWTIGLLAGAPLLLMGFTISSVHALAPLDDRSFLRTRPPGRSGGFRRVIGAHLALLAGLALVILIHCALRNLGWRAAGYGVTAVVSLAGACMVLSGVATTLASSRSYSPIWANLVVVAPAVFSAALLAHWTRGLDPENLRDWRFGGPETTLMVGVPIMGLIWWLGAARGRVRTCFVLLLGWGILAPWVWKFGYWCRIDGTPDREIQVSAAQVRWTGETAAEGMRAGAIEIDDRIEVSGLVPAESLVIYQLRIGWDKWWVGRVDEETGGMVRRGRAYVGSKSGMGEVSVRPDEEVLGKMLGGTVELWNSGEPMAPGDMVFAETSSARDPALTPADQWRFEGYVRSYEKVAEFTVKDGVRLRLRTNGELVLHGMERDEAGAFIREDHFMPDLGTAEDRWPGKSLRHRWVRPRVVFEGRDGRMFLAPYANTPKSLSTMSGPLLDLHRPVIRLGLPDPAESRARYEWLMEAKAHLFLEEGLWVDSSDVRK